MRDECRFPRAAALLLPLSHVYGVGVHLRRKLYNLGRFRRFRSGARVISIGNITVGGTGKTPFVVMVAERLKSLGVRAAIVSRGYGREPSDSVLVVSEGCGPRVDSFACGDEAFLIAESTRDIVVATGRQRYEVSRFCEREFGVDAIVLDDGFQHLRLERDLDIVLLDSSRPLRNGRLIPSGHLRERPQVLGLADLIVGVDRWPGSSPNWKHVAESFAPEVPKLRVSLEPHLLRVAPEMTARPLEWLSGRRVHAVSGIANPPAFETMLDALGADIVRKSRFRDHHDYAFSDWVKICARGEEADAELIVTTAKDVYKLMHFLRGEKLVFLVLKVVFQSGEEKFMQTLGNLF